MEEATRPSDDASSTTSQRQERTPPPLHPRLLGNVDLNQDILVGIHSNSSSHDDGEDVPESIAAAVPIVITPSKDDQRNNHTAAPSTTTGGATMTSDDIQRLMDSVQPLLTTLATVMTTLATKDDLTMLATKEEIKTLATKEDLKTLATKEEMDARFDSMDSDLASLKRGLGNLLKNAPESMLDAMDVQILDDRETQLLGAVVGENGFGAATWTFVKHGTDCFALSCAHCALAYATFPVLDASDKAYGRNASEKQLVVFPKALKGLVKSVALLKEGHRFGVSYSDAREQDVVLLQLKRFPEWVDKDKVFDWETWALERKVHDYVVGHSLKSPVIGRNAVFQEELDPFWPFAAPPTVGRWLAMSECRAESGHSGTAMFGFSKKDGPAYLQAGDVEKKAITPRLLGVYTGLAPEKKGLEPRLFICPMRSSDDFVKLDRTNPLKKFTLAKAKKGAYDVWEKDGVWVKALGDDTFFKEDGSPTSVLYGMFVKSDYADGKTKLRLEEAERKRKEKANESKHQENKNLGVSPSNQTKRDGKERLKSRGAFYNRTDGTADVTPCKDDSFLPCVIL